MRHKNTSLSERQETIWRYILDCVRLTGRQPNQPEMAKHFSVTIEAIRFHLRALERLGYIEIHFGRGFHLLRCTISIREHQKKVLHV